MQNFYRLTTGVNITPLMVAISRQPELWKEDTYLRNFPQGPFGEVDSIMLRFPKKVVLPSDADVELYKQNLLPGYDQHESIDYPAYAKLTEARTMVMAVFAAVGGERLGRVMINRIAPGGRIFPHADSPEHASYYTRFHIVLHSNPGNVFRCGDEQIHMQTGEVWYFNNALEHEVINNSDDYRIHIVMDCRTARVNEVEA